MSQLRKVQVWIYRHAGPQLEVLIFKTTPKRGDFWQPVTGSVEAGESYEQAAQREAVEESGLIFDSQPTAIGYEFEFTGFNGNLVHEVVFSVRVTGDGAEVKLDPHEHVEYEWVKPKTAQISVKHESNREALKVFLEKISGS